MAQKDNTNYICLHSPCSFKTDKRKAIYTHLVRTHNERKEDFECEYCLTVFKLDSEIEQHLHLYHPQQPFTYTCVSRIENIISKCAKLGSDSNSVLTQGDLLEQDINISSDANDSFKSVENFNILNKNFRPIINQRTRASVNESLNNIAKQPKFCNQENTFVPIQNDDGNETNENMEAGIDDEEECNINSEGECPTYISEPLGLKIKLSLKKISRDKSRDSSPERSISPPLLEPHIGQPEEFLDHSDIEESSPPKIIPTHSKYTAQIRDKASKYFDKLEVYHVTDDFGRRCCPFCDYKTSKNTIRVHLSGIHKIHFVKCSLCDYKAAFPHQITQHGIKFHKTTNLNIIQLSKESREQTIAKLKSFANVAECASTDEQSSYSYTLECHKEGKNEPMVVEEMNSNDSFASTNDEEAEAEIRHQQELLDDRTFPAPKCQTSKTDYYSIEFQNGLYLYSCNLCSFKTPVRATIYTHKYRHEDKAYRCGYCDFTSAPRSNVVHHCRTKHKDLSVHVIEHSNGDHLINTDTTAASTHTTDGITKVKIEPADTVENEVHDSRETKINAPENLPYKEISQSPEKPQHMIIKVPQFKRSLTSTGYNMEQRTDSSKRTKLEYQAPTTEYKLSLNKLYRINPGGSPKFICVMCSYACDTHPKMKHHLYRHRPQKYKCPYCDHRKYPRSYVVRHVRDTHRNKPVRVIDLSKGNEPEDIPEYMMEISSNTVGHNEEANGHHIHDNLGEENTNNSYGDSKITIKQEPGLINDDSYCSDDNRGKITDDKRSFTQILNLRSVITSNYNDDTFLHSPDVSPNFSEAVYTSTPLIESIINGQFQSSTTKQYNKTFDKKKSLKDYRVNFGQGPRYICNKCDYGTENYKTIHNHMYRHESQRYQCPYCGYRRSPRSFVENHIREVHKGHPIVVTELDLDREKTMFGQGINQKCKNSSPDHNPSITLQDHSKANDIKASETLPIIHGKWPAPKPASQLKLSLPNSSSSTTQKMSPIRMLLTSGTLDSGTGVHNKVSTPEQLAVVNKQSPEFTKRDLTPLNTIKYKDGNRTTYKTMYKCVFDPETCNHISKDKSKMKQHLFMHVEYKPWSCDFCEMTASQSSHIKNHVRTEHQNFPETSFKYKRHNYLEKHIGGFLTKGLFTVPVNEYRVIMDMKGNTKTSKQPSFTRDQDGNLLCPYCSYKTKSGGMTDHVKIKHMQPRFKCHWCDYMAFYRSEIRKHHRKEKSHINMEFKVQELDLVRVIEGFREANGEGIHDAISTIDTVPENTESQYTQQDNIQNDILHNFDDDDDDDNDDDEDDDYYEDYDNEEDDIDKTDSSASETSYVREIDRQNHVERINNDNNGVNNKSLVQAAAVTENVLLGELNTEVSADECMKMVKLDTKQEITKKAARFMCGFCAFSATLRVAIKLHCAKKHHGKEPLVIDILNKPSDHNIHDSQDLLPSEDEMRVHAEDWKGTRFEQDLKRAGVAKLNLASLFPNSKRFQNSIGNDAEDRTSESDCENDCDLPDYDSSKEQVQFSFKETSPKHFSVPQHAGSNFKPCHDVIKGDDVSIKNGNRIRKCESFYMKYTDVDFKKPFDPVLGLKPSEKKSIDKSQVQTQCGQFNNAFKKREKCEGLNKVAEHLENVKLEQTCLQSVNKTDSSEITLVNNQEHTEIINAVGTERAVSNYKNFHHQYDVNDSARHNIDKTDTDTSKEKGMVDAPSLHIDHTDTLPYQSNECLDLEKEENEDITVDDPNADVTNQNDVNKDKSATMVDNLRAKMKIGLKEHNILAKINGNDSNIQNHQSADYGTSGRENIDNCELDNAIENEIAANKGHIKNGMSVNDISDGVIKANVDNNIPSEACLI